MDEKNNVQPPADLKMQLQAFDLIMTHLGAQEVEWVVSALGVPHNPEARRGIKVEKLARWFFGDEVFQAWVDEIVNHASKAIDLALERLNKPKE